MPEAEHKAAATAAALRWIMFRLISTAPAPRATLVDFQRHMEEYAAACETSGMTLLGKGSADGYTNATDSASATRELAEELIAAVVIK